MGGRLQDKVAIVTGSSRVLGRAFAVGFAEEGASVVVTSRNLSSARTVADELGAAGHTALALELDVSSEESVAALARETLARFGRIDILVNNAGIATPFRHLVDMPVEEWDRIFQVNLRGAFLCCRAVLPAMIEQHYGKIINIAAGVHEERVHVGIGAYCASKIGLVNLTRSLAAETRPYGIHVNAIDPGAVRTGMAESFEVSEETTAWLARQQTLDVPAQLRFRPPGDIVPLAVFLASDDSRALNGRFLQASSQGSPKYLQL